jgi:hypothetical protein
MANAKYFVIDAKFQLLIIIKISPFSKGKGCKSSLKPQGCGYASERQEVSES